MKCPRVESQNWCEAHLLLIGGFLCCQKMGEEIGYTYPIFSLIFLADTKSDKHTANGVEGAILAPGNIYT
jgi:hypothetical protein